jgi:hypothetical protein
MPKPRRTLKIQRARAFIKDGIERFLKRCEKCGNEAYVGENSQYVRCVRRKIVHSRNPIRLAELIRLQREMIQGVGHKVKPILEDQNKQMKATREDTTLTQDQKRDEMKQLHESTHSQINDMLTSEQQKKFAELKEQQKEHHEGNKPDGTKQPY